MRLGQLAMTALLLALPAAASAGTVADAFYRLYWISPGGPQRVLSADPLPAGSNVPPNNQWRYDYEVLNKSPVALNTFLAFFNSDNVLRAQFVSGAAPASWTVLQQGPFAPDVNFKVRYRTTVAAAKITQNNRLLCTATFAWTGSQTPGPQNYDAVTDGGSEAGVTVEIIDVTSAAARSWGRVKALYRGD